MRAPHIASYVLALLIAGLAPLHAAEHRFDDYGFRVRVPDRYRQARNAAADHGWGFFLDHRTSRAEYTSDRRPYFSAFAEVQSDRESGLEDLRKEYCIGTLTPPPSGLAFAGAHSTSCEFVSHGGWRDIWVLAFGAEPGMPKTAPLYTYHMQLHTTRQRFDRDLAVFRRAVQTMQIARPL